MFRPRSRPTAERDVEPRQPLRCQENPGLAESSEIPNLDRLLKTLAHALSKLLRPEQNPDPVADPEPAHNPDPISDPEPAQNPDPVADPEPAQNPDPVADPGTAAPQSPIKEAVKKTPPIHTDSEDSSDGSHNYLDSSSDEEEETTQSVAPAPPPAKPGPAAKQRTKSAAEEKKKKHKDARKLDKVDWVKKQIDEICQEGITPREREERLKQIMHPILSDEERRRGPSPKPWKVPNKGWKSESHKAIFGDE